MAVRLINQLGDSILSKPAREVKKINSRIQMLLDDMAETMYEAEGVGLAAPQVGILRRAIVVDIGEGLFQLVNPEIISEKGSQLGEEGCLSIPGERGVVKRPYSVVLRALNYDGDEVEIEAEGFLARAFCHEVDHLNGVLYVDVMDRMLEEDEAFDEIIDTGEGETA